MNSYKEECMAAKRAREGIIGQREKIYSKRKKTVKNWVVYWSIWGNRNGANNFSSFHFAEEEDAVRYADKIHRRFATHRLPREDKEYVWVVNDGADRG